MKEQLLELLRIEFFYIDSFDDISILNFMQEQVFFHKNIFLVLRTQIILFFVYLCKNDR